MFGIQVEISNICQYGSYDWFYSLEESDVQFTFQKRQLGWVLGPIKNEGNKMNQTFLKITGRVVSCRTNSHLTDAELNSVTEKS